MLNAVKAVTLDNLHKEVWAMRSAGFRLVTMTCTDLGDAFDILYHFDLNYELQHLRLCLPKGQALPSVAAIFFAAVLVENEMKDLFGLVVSDLPIDYKGRFILAEDAPKAPLAKTVGIPLDIRVRAPAAAPGEESHGA